MVSSLAHIALAGVTALSWLGLGDVLLKRLGRSGDRALDLLNRIGAGAVGWALATFGAGLGGALYAWAYVPLAVAAAAWGLGALRQAARGFRPPALRAWPRWQVALLALLVLYVLVDLIATAAPITSPDALAYHAAAPAAFERVHEIRELPWSWAAYQPFTVEMLMLDGFLLWDDVQSAFASLLLAFGALAAVAGAANRLGGRTIALLAATIFFAQPFMTWAATSTFVEPALAFVLALAAWNLIAFLRGGGAASLALAGLFAGAGAGIKYVGVATAAALVLAGIVLARGKLGRRSALAFALPAVLVGLPWYLKNAMQTGDPIYPLLAGGPNREAEFSRDAILEGYGAGRGPGDFLLLPFRLLAEGNRFDRGDFISPLFLMFAPLALLDRRARRSVVVVIAAAILYLVAWFVASQQARFLLPLMAPLAVLAALGLVAFSARGRLARLVSISVTVAALTAGVGGTAVYASQFFGVAAGFESKDAFLERKTSYYALDRWLNAHVPAGARVLTSSSNSLYLERQHDVLTLDLLPTQATPAEARRLVERHTYAYVALLAGDTARLAQFTPLGGRVVARVRAREVRSRTRAELGPEATFVVIELP